MPIDLPQQLPARVLMSLDAGLGALARLVQNFQRLLDGFVGNRDTFFKHTQASAHEPTKFQ